ncbi:MAG: PEP/pyruvate-binding domain-containing protein [Thermodesulfobacteriota bacterium]
MPPWMDLFRPREACRLLTPLTGPQARRYQVFKRYLNFNNAALGALAELEQAYYGGRPFTPAWARRKYEELVESVLGAVYSLESLTGDNLARLESLVLDLDRTIEPVLTPSHPPAEAPLVIPFAQIQPNQRGLVGAKACNLALIQSVLELPAPPGFAVTAAASRMFLAKNGLEAFIERQLAGINPDDNRSIERAGAAIRQRIVFASRVPAILEAEILEAFEDLAAQWGPDLRLAMRSSAIGEDTEASFAGQYETVLNVTPDNLSLAYQQVLASKYNSRAIAYRLHRGLDDRETPMAVAGVAMLNPRSAGVLYTRDPAAPQAQQMRINAVWGLGEQLVAGNVSPDTLLISRDAGEVVERSVSLKTTQLVNLAQGGTASREVPPAMQFEPSLADADALTLAAWGLKLEDYFGGPQDVEWALDQDGRLFLLQSRPLELAQAPAEQGPIARDYAGHPVLLFGGRGASPGIAAGPVCVVGGSDDLDDAPQGCVLVAPTASPDLARLAGQVKGIVTEVGSVASHLASVAREFGIPALFDAPDATRRLPQGQVVTLWADQRLVYEGAVPDLLAGARPARNLMVESPVHQRLRRVLDLAAPLNLTDPNAPGFAPKNCKSYHDVVRYTHETAVRAMFELGQGNLGQVEAVKLTSTVPMDVRLIDLGGGLKPGLTTCDAITPEHIESTPFKALWGGLSHPGINWTSTVPVNLKGMVTLMAGGGPAAGGAGLGSASYALISRDYLNFSARFGYHFANLDCLCGDTQTQNYLTLQFAGGAGDYHGRALRVQFLSEVLSRLGLKVAIKGDLLEAHLTDLDRAGLIQRLDQVGRLLASSRLLDVGLANRGQVEPLVESFFNKDYDYLSLAENRELKDYYLPVGNWSRDGQDGRACLKQDGTPWRTGLSAGIAGLATKLLGERYYDFLDHVAAYHYFPLAVKKASRMADGAVSCRVKTVAGVIDRVGGLAFGLTDIGNFYVWRLSALEQNLVLFQFVAAKRHELARVRQPIKSNHWHELKVAVQDRRIRCHLDGELLLNYLAEAPVQGFVGLWSKADSVTYFCDLMQRTQ